jgi:hypothetical protein
MMNTLSLLFANRDSQSVLLITLDSSPGSSGALCTFSLRRLVTGSTNGILETKHAQNTRTTQSTENIEHRVMSNVHSMCSNEIGQSLNVPVGSLEDVRVLLVVCRIEQNRWIRVNVNACNPVSTHTRTHKCTGNEGTWNFVLGIIHYCNHKRVDVLVAFSKLCPCRLELHAVWAPCHSVTASTAKVMKQ